MGCQHQHHQAGQTILWDITEVCKFFWNAFPESHTSVLTNEGCEPEVGATKQINITETP